MTTMNARVAAFPSRCSHALQCPNCRRVWSEGVAPIHRVWCPACLQTAVARQRRRARIRSAVHGAIAHVREATRRVPDLVLILALLVLFLTLLYSDRYPHGLDSTFPPPPDLQR